MWHYPGEAYLYGFQLFDKDGNKLFESASREPYTNSNYKSTETILSEEERIIGFKSRKVNDRHAIHNDF
jgi:hypothetical protein